MKKLLTLLAAVTLSVATSISFAAGSSLLSLTDGTGTPASGGPVIFVIHNTTPDGKVIMADELIVSVGKTCNTLTQQSDVTSNLIDIPVRNKNSLLSSDDLIHIFGTGQGCIRVDIRYDGDKTVSTGNVALTWDATNKEYVAANPAIANTNFQ